uniref:DNA polymerase eta n=1 Tax=Reticulitermes speratus TaxID=60591 RepID=A0A2Z5U652_9NEOP
MSSTDLFGASCDISTMDRIITLVDMDCFYCQVEARLNPSLKGKPLAVVQYNKWKGGGIIAVNYEARNFGVTRNMRGDEAKKKCPNIVLVHVPEVRGKADLTKYRDAGCEVVDVFCQFSDCVQRASVDEAYIDVTEAVEQRISSFCRVQPSQLATTFVVGFTDINSNDEETRLQGITSWLESVYALQDPAQLRLAVAGVIVEEMRAAVYQQTGFRCSAGISHNKILGKLACGLHKPNRQTVLPQAGVMELYKTLPIRKVRNLGGKFGCVVMEQLDCEVMADLLQFTKNQLQQRFDEKMGTWLYNIARGIDHDPVTKRLLSKSIGCCKNFPGRQALTTSMDVQFWLSKLTAEVAERLAKDLEENKRRAKLLTVSYHQDIDSRNISSSRSGPLTSYDPQKIMADAFELVKKSNTGCAGAPDVWYPPLKYLGLSVGKFVSEDAAQNSTIHDFFKVTQKELNKAVSKNVTELSKVVHENINGMNNQEPGTHKPLTSLKNMYNADGSKMTVSDKGKVSSTGSSFFMNYLKQHNVVKSAETGSGKVSVGTSENRSADNIDQPISKHIHGTDSDNDMFDSPVADTEKVKENESDVHLRTTVTQLNLDALTSATKEHVNDTTKMWVSVEELFPDINNVDDDVVALLPASLKKRLQSQIENAKHNSVSNKHAVGTITMLGDGKLINARDSLFVGSHTKCGAEEVSEVVKVSMHVDECVPESESEKQLCNRSKSATSLNLLDHCDDQKDDLLSKSSHALQGAKEENRDLIQVGDDIVPPEAKQQYLSANHISLSCRDESVRASTDIAGHNKAKSYNVTSVTLGMSEENDVKDNMNVVAEVCPHCRKAIPLNEYPEHLDFHTAEKLHEELNGRAVQMRTAVSTSALNKKPSLELPTKRKRGALSKKPSMTDRDKKTRTITAFFTPK